MNFMWRVISIFLLTICYSCNSEATLINDPCADIVCDSGEECINGTCTDINIGTEECTKGNILNGSRADCTETLNFSAEFSMSENGSTRTISANNIPAHKVGLFGNVAGAANPNAIAPQSSSYSVTSSPQLASSKTQLLGNSGPDYAFGVLLNGVELDPVAAEPWPHIRGNFAQADWDWNLEALNVNLGLDCNNAHVQPTGKYHYHASPTLYIESLQATSDQMTLVGYAGDGFPIYNKYAYSDANNMDSAIVEMQPSYQLKQGIRPGDGDSAPCGNYDGVYTQDYEFVENVGDLDECNGRMGVTPEFPGGTYYYVLTTEFPAIPRCFSGTPSNDFRIGM
jgi:hypothetical protein